MLLIDFLGSIGSAQLPQIICLYVHHVLLLLKTEILPCSCLLFPTISSQAEKTVAMQLQRQCRFFTTQRPSIRSTQCPGTLQQRSRSRLAVKVDTTTGLDSIVSSS